MTESADWAFPERLQPRQERLQFDLDSALRAVVLVHAEIPETAFTASVLGTERIGHGVAIDSQGLVLTIGYLITEAETIWLTTREGNVVPAHALAYDQVTGFGLVLPLGKLNVPFLRRGSSAEVAVGDDVTVIGHGGLEHSLQARIIARREFAGYWEYLLDDAIFTAPAHPQWGGTALVGPDGTLRGVGSLLVQEVDGADSVDANMFVPTDLLDPILEQMVRLGRPARPSRPWLGLYATPLKGSLVVRGLAEGGPAQRAGIQVGDVLLEVAGEPVPDLAALYRRIWSSGPAGAEIVITLARGAHRPTVRVASADREDFLAKPRRH